MSLFLRSWLGVRCDSRTLTLRHDESVCDVCRVVNAEPDGQHDVDAAQGVDGDLGGWMWEVVRDGQVHLRGQLVDRGEQVARRLRHATDDPKLLQPTPRALLASGACTKATS